MLDALRRRVAKDGRDPSRGVAVRRPRLTGGSRFQQGHGGRLGTSSLPRSLKTQLRWIRNPNVGVAAALGSAPVPSLKAKHSRSDPGRQSVSQHESAADGALFAPSNCGSTVTLLQEVVVWFSTTLGCFAAQPIFRCRAVHITKICPLEVASWHSRTSSPRSSPRGGNQHANFVAPRGFTCIRCAD
jgi:hypothetical protein